MKKIVAINYFEQRVDRVGLEEYKASEAYTKDVELAKGDWAFAQLQDQVEENFTSCIPVAESTGDEIAYDYYRLTDYALTLYVRDMNGNNTPFIRFKFDNAELDPKTDRELTDDEIELANCIIEAENLDVVVA